MLRTQKIKYSRRGRDLYRAVRGERMEWNALEVADIGSDWLDTRKRVILDTKRLTYIERLYLKLFDIGHSKDKIIDILAKKLNRMSSNRLYKHL
jgi:hypothetical protein